MIRRVVTSWSSEQTKAPTRRLVLSKHAYYGIWSRLSTLRHDIKVVINRAQRLKNILQDAIIVNLPSPSPPRTKPEDEAHKSGRLDELLLPRGKLAGVSLKDSPEVLPQLLMERKPAPACRGLPAEDLVEEAKGLAEWRGDELGPVGSRDQGQCVGVDDDVVSRHGEVAQDTGMLVRDERIEVLLNILEVYLEIWRGSLANELNSVCVYLAQGLGRPRILGWTHPLRGEEAVEIRVSWGPT